MPCNEAVDPFDLRGGSQGGSNGNDLLVTDFMCAIMKNIRFFDSCVRLVWKYGINCHLCLSVFAVENSGEDCRLQSRRKGRLRFAILVNNTRSR